MDFYKGSDKGRIYRVMPAGGAYKKAAPALSKATSDSLVQLFAHPNQWYALQAHRLLVERQDKTVIPALQNMFHQSADPRARLHALYVLEAFDALNAGIVKEALADSSNDVKEHAIILAENYPALLADLVALAKDATAKITLQTALSLGQFNAPQVTPALVQVMEHYGNYREIQMAVLSSNAGSAPAMLSALFKSNLAADSTKLPNVFIHDCSYVIGNRNDKAQLEQFVSLLDQPGMAFNKRQAIAIKGFVNGWEKSTTISAELKKELGSLKSSLKNITVETIDNLKKLVASTK